MTQLARAFGRVCIVGALVFVSCLALALTIPAQADDGQPWAALRAGGIVLFRHAHAPGGGDPPNMKLGECATQRNLDQTGRDQARRLGAMMRQQNVSVGRVVASHWCRASETADLAFPGRVEIEPSFNSFFDDRSRAAVQTEQSRKLLSEWRGPGALVVVTHQVNIQALTGLTVSSGEGVVLSVNSGKLTVIGRIGP